MASQSPYRADIDGLRALAVLAVLGFHAFPELLPGGFLGVDVFFAISGYVVTAAIWPALSQRTLDLGAFYARRARRLLPALLPVLIAVWGMAWCFATPDDARRIGQTVAAGAAFFTNFVLLRGGGYFDRESVAQPLLHLWSLGVEAQFYLCQRHPSFPQARYFKFPHPVAMMCPRRATGRGRLSASL